MATAPSLVWFRQDLRLEDNPALLAAIEREAPIIPVYIWAPGEEGDWPPGAAARWWLHQSLKSLDANFRKAGSRLILRKGNSLAELRRLIREAKADAVFWSRRYEPAAIARDTIVQSALREDGLSVDSFNSALLFEPHAAVKDDGEPYRVFTPFWKSCLAKAEPPEPLPAPSRLPAPSQWPRSLALKELSLEPEIDWAEGLRESWKPGEAGAKSMLGRFLNGPVFDYGSMRDRPDQEGTSRLSPHLHFGEISPRRVWHDTRRADARKKSGEAMNSEEFLRQLGWREFSYSMIFHFQKTTNHPLRPEFAKFPWVEDPDALRAWQKGRTGYPLVDAGMRQLWRTGWMHNRARMVAASFLVKHLRIHWLEGARWFWDTLVDADLANNTMGWQWTAGCGADAAPFFRIFNPMSQAARFDPEGDYIRRWIPELKSLDTSSLQTPWEATPAALNKAGITLGETYPHPIVDHSEARNQALAAYESIKGKKKP